MALSSILSGVSTVAKIAGGLGGAISGFSSSRKSAKRARKSRRAGEELARNTLAFAREVFGQFQPVIADTTNFFSSVPLGDIVSGKVLAPGTAGAIGIFNRGAAQAETRLKADLARRGIANSSVGGSSIAEFEIGKARGVADLSLAGINKAIDRRTDLTKVGVGTASAPIQVGLSNSRQLLQQAGLSEQQASQSIANAGKSAGFGLAQLEDLIN